MMFERWQTSEKFYPQNAVETFGLRGFHGGYEVRVMQVPDDVITSQIFQLSQEDIVVHINVQ